VNKVACAVDCGQVINPDSVRAQMEGGIVHGLNAALYGRTRWSNGRATPLNFDDYRMLRLREMPAISVTIIPSTAPPSGTGEPGVPPIAPAIVNAYARLTGTRLRSLPLRGGG
jgi:isoquinoline 1-oxidoreductase beta subunit